MTNKTIFAITAALFLCAGVNAQTPDTTSKRVIVKPKREAPIKAIPVQKDQSQTDSAKINPGRQEMIPVKQKKKSKKRIR